MLGLKDPADLLEMDPIALNYYRACFMHDLQREKELAAMNIKRGLL